MSRARLQPVAIAAVALALVGLIVNVWRPWSPEFAGATRLDEFPQDVLTAIAAYRWPRVLVAIFARVLVVGLPLGVLLSRRGQRLVELVGGQPTGRIGRIARPALVGGLIALLVWAAVLPLAAWSGLVHDGRWGIRTASAALWWRDRAVSGAIDIASTAVLVAGLVALVRRAPRSWPWHLTWIGTALTGLLALVWPLLISPLFLPTRPLEDGPVHAAVEELLADAGMQDAPVLVADASTRTTRINAQVTGLGPSRRVVLHDTLLDRPLSEIRSVVAHELGHRANRDIARGVVGSALGLLLAGLVLRWALRSMTPRLWPDTTPTPARLAAVAAVGIIVLPVIAEPVVLWQSRRVEAAADFAALELAEDPAALIAIQRAFVVRDLAAPDPPRWQTVLFSTHPTVGDRIRTAAGYAGQHDLPLPSLESYLRDEQDAERPWHRPD